MNGKMFFFNKNNNLENFKYANNNKIIFKSKKLSRFATKKFLLLENNNLIF